MPARVWTALAGIIALLLAAVVGLDRWQAQRGEPSLFGFSWTAGSGASRAEPRPTPPAPRPGAGTAPSAGGRVAVIVDDLGGRRDVFESVKALGRPLSVAILPELPLSGWIAREAARAGMEVLLDLPMEPYRYPELDPGPGALLLSMSDVELRRLLERHLASLPGVVGVINHLGSRLTEDRIRMRIVLEGVRGRSLFFVDAYSTNHSVAYDEARALRLRAGRRLVLVDHADGETGDRARWEQVARWAERRGEAIVIAHGHPLTARLLKEYIPRWEARALRLVPVSQLVR